MSPHIAAVQNNQVPLFCVNIPIKTQETGVLMCLTHCLKLLQICVVLHVVTSSPWITQPNGDTVFMVQVNQWLTWLETAEEEESEEEDYWGTGQSHVLSGCNDFFLTYLHVLLSVSTLTLSSLLVLWVFSNHCYKFIPLRDVLPDQASITTMIVIFYLCLSF